MPERPNMQYILKKRIVQGDQKLYSHVSNAQMQNKVPKRPNMWYLFEKAIVQGYLLSLAQLGKCSKTLVTENVHHGHLICTVKLPGGGVVCYLEKIKCHFGNSGWCRREYSQLPVKRIKAASDATNHHVCG